ncbi:hypothetical protein LCGC14_1069100 [marine sediment metagenome]|uniref:Uncharacterized protein n=1 Tax=marine sediment metagenome TaxID=412755 RepID=A0A0F9N5U9_9ZZZZ|nr:hypothetical protein [Pricia sp.]
MSKIKLGQEVIDTISGFTGIAVAGYEFLNGCRRISVQPKVDKDGKLPEDKAFDEPQLKVVKKGKYKNGNKDDGGPSPYTPEGRPEPKR